MSKVKKFCPFKEDDWCEENCALACHDFASNELTCAFTFMARYLAIISISGWGNDK